MERAIQAIILSQYRLKIFQDSHLHIKPVVLFKSAKIAESKSFMEEFNTVVANLTGEYIEQLSTLTDNETMQVAYKYFRDNGISYENLAQELREDFSVEHCISANDDKEAEEKQIALNTLEDTNNPYRAVFEVKKLDEGWDVLNLFDIVRLYETRDAKNGIPGKTTIAEAQLIGRGSRYCPFKVNNEQNKFVRKYDEDISNPLRICEELYYHCQISSRYIDELKKALREIGIDLDKTVQRQYKLKSDFKSDPLYIQGYVFENERVEKSRKEITGLPDKVRNYPYAVRIATGQSGEDVILSDDKIVEQSGKLYTKRMTFSQIAEINYAIVHKALSKNNVYKFNILKSYFPNLKSTREFIIDENYLGDIHIDITTKYEEPTISILSKACESVLSKIANSISSIEITYFGTKQFTAKHLHEVFKDNKIVNFTDPKDGGKGISQNDSSVPMAWKIDLSKEDWYAFEDNFGTSEEKAFVAYFKNYVDSLNKKYDKVYLLRNERQLKIYSFKDGERFEPDYILFLHKKKSDGYEQLQVFIEPKGTHLLEKDKWKEEFLLEIKENAIPVVFADDNKYKIWGFHFFNQEHRSKEFDDDMNML